MYVPIRIDENIVNQAEEKTGIDFEHLILGIFAWVYSDETRLNEAIETLKKVMGE